MAGSTQAEISSQLHRTAVVTGATGGLGYETALALAKAGSEVILTGRDDRKGRSAIEKISREVTSAKVSYEHLDLASLTSVADFAQRMHGSAPRSGWDSGPAAPAQCDRGCRLRWLRSQTSSRQARRGRRRCGCEPRLGWRATVAGSSRSW